MPLETGTKLGPYEITGAVGAGGMGEVYRARDTRLGRTVAVKVLSTRLADRPDLQKRFEREARTISKLSHPHICTLHDVGQQEGVDFLVMEYLEGETLAYRLHRGPLPPEQILKYGVEVAEALEAAHRQGIIHRDLKPANIMLTKSGAKLMDFGLAKLAEQPAPVAVTLSEMANAPTLPSEEKSLTEEGVIVGTFQYMAPEQLEGKEADARTDLFALGMVLYEMATGRPAFTGRTKASVIAAILSSEPPPISQLQPLTPSALDRVVKTCLAKDPEERFETAHDVKLQLKWISEGGSQVSAAPVARRRHNRERLAWGAVALLGLAALLLGVDYVRRMRQPQSGAVQRFVVSQPPGSVLYAGLTSALAVSPDGQYIVYRATQATGGWRLYLHSLSELEAAQIPGSEDALNPFFSPDGKWVAFFASGKLKKVAVSGGSPLTICDAPEGRGASWGADDTIIFGVTGNAGLRRVSAKGGKSEELTKLDASQKELSHRWPEILPGGKDVLFAVQGASADWDTARIAVLSLKTGKWRTLVEGGSNPHYSPSGHLTFARTGTLLAVPFNLERLEVTGSPIPVLEDVYMNRVGGNAEAALSPEGTLLYLAGKGTDAPRELVWVDRKGQPKPLGMAPGAYEQPSLSPDGKKVALHIQPPSDDVWEYDLGRGTLTRLTFQAGEDETPVWAPDGKRVAYSANMTNEPRAILWKNADGSGKEEVLAATGFHIHLGSFSPDGRLLAYTNYESETRGDLWVLPLDGDRKPRPFLQTPFNERDAKVSPDGRWLAYTSDETGRDEVYVQALEGAGGKFQVSSQGGFGALWARNGRELFYRDDNKVMAVAVTTQPGFTAASPRLLFEGPYEIHPRREGIWDVSPDGQNFLMSKAVGRENFPVQLRVVLNFFSEIRSRTREGGSK